ncbi:MAG: hypothetical protein ACRD3W_16295 [Terriglobales bacterium]
MNFPDSNILKGTIADLKDIVSRSQGDDTECVRLLSQIEAIVGEIERKAPDLGVPSNISVVLSQAVAPVIL